MSLRERGVRRLGAGVAGLPPAAAASTAPAHVGHVARGRGGATAERQVRNL